MKMRNFASLVAAVMAIAAFGVSTSNAEEMTWPCQSGPFEKSTLVREYRVQSSDANILVAQTTGFQLVHIIPGEKGNKPEVVPIKTNESIKFVDGVDFDKIAVEFMDGSRQVIQFEKDENGRYQCSYMQGSIALMPTKARDVLID